MAGLAIARPAIDHPGAIDLQRQRKIGPAVKKSSSLWRSEAESPLAAFSSTRCLITSIFCASSASWRIDRLRLVAQ
ncbi:hypothetical protein ACOTFB_20440 [Achromobacter xylosoxidans]